MIPKLFPVIIEKPIEIESEVDVSHSIFALGWCTSVWKVPVERIIPIPKKVIRQVEKIVDVPIEVPYEPLVETEEGLIPLSQWSLLKDATLVKGDNSNQSCSTQQVWWWYMTFYWRYVKQWKA